MNVWLGMVVLLTLVWSLKAGVKPGLNFHLLGATVFTLCFGPRLAFVGLCLVLAGVTLNGGAGILAYAINALLLAGLGVLIAQAVHLVVSRLLPANFFVFIFVNSFFGAALTILGIGFAISVLMFLSGVYPWDYLFNEYFPYFMLLGFSEAWLSGMLATLFVIYRPNWIASFDDSRYLANK
ncbi:MAG: putative integral rane protein [Proteobacteria bacterium]|nr:putative integral rane protein [Pseudomonadota bacterium]